MSYIPDVGDIVWLEFDPQMGREQAGHRPAVVLSPKSYNQKTSLMICCPVTTQVKGYPFEVLITGGNRENVALSDQIKSLDWVARKAVKKGKISDTELHKIRQIASILLGLKP